MAVETTSRAAMQFTESLPRLSSKAPRVVVDAAASPKYLARLSWEKSLLDNHHHGDASRSPSMYGGLSSSASVPSLPASAPWALHGKTVAESASAANQGDKGPLSFKESMGEVERMVREHVARAQRQRVGGKTSVSTLKHGAAERGNSTKIEFEFAPLRDVAMLAATTELQVSEETNGLDGGAKGSDTDWIQAERDGVESAGASKYFGSGARAAYYKTYQELHGKPHLFVKKPKIRPQTKTLKASSALNSAMQLRKASILMSMSTLTSGTTGSDGKITASSLVKRRLALLPLDGNLSGPTRVRTDTATLSGASDPSLHSPRVLFLSSCIAKSHPAISLVLRKENCHVFDFSHQSLGDDFIIQFATCLPDLPHVEEINVRDNRLSDRALNELLVALENNPNLIKLDISENEMGRDSARSLRKYIASSLCTIKTLVLNDADIDDHECTLFMMAFERNKSVEKLLMSSNRIGQTRKSMALGAAAYVASTLPQDKDAAGALLPTGGEAVGAMLTVNLTIQELDLSWNMLRHNSTAPIAASLQLNYNLLDLNLSYNGCGDGGAMQLGHALRSNSALRKLNLAYNSIGPRGGLVLASGLIVNKGLKELVLDGNTIGLDSGRELMHASCSRIHSTAVCTLSMFECNLTSAKRFQLPKGKSHLGKGDPVTGGVELNMYNPSDPTGKYHLDLSDPYEHMIAHELLRLATFKRGYRFVKLEHTTAGSPKVTMKIELHRDQKRKETIATQGEAVSTASSGQSSLALLFSKIDKDNSGSVDKNELADAMRAYGFRISDALLEQVLNEYDYDKSGALGVDEFEAFFLRCGFAMIDTDHSGSLNEQEIEKVLKLMGFESINEREIKRMIAQYDFNNSGEIDEQEFMEFMKAEVLERMRTVEESSPTSTDDAAPIAARLLEEKYERTALRDPSGVIWKVPTSGSLFAEFQYDVDVATLSDDSNRDTASEGPSRRGHHAGRATQLIANSAISTLLENAQKMSKSNEEQADFLSAVLDTSDLFFTAAQAEDVLTKQGATKSWPRKRHALERILAQMANRREAISLINRMVDPARQWQQRRELRRSIPKLYSVLLGCPTNRYRFDLQNAVDRIALKQLATLAHEEKLFSKNRSGRNDTSQNGDWENFRHARVNGHVWLLTSTFILNSLLGPTNLALLTKTTPNEAVGAGGFVEGSQVKRFVEFDYVSTTRPPRGSKALTARRFEQLMDVWLNSESIVKDDAAESVENDEGEEVKTNAQLRWEILRNHVRSSRLQDTSTTKMSIFQMKATMDGIHRKIELLELLICDRWVSCEQAVALIAVLPDVVFARARATVLLFSRIVDLENFVTIFDSLSKEDQGECVKRLGWLNILDPVQPDRQYPPLNLSIHDERELVQLLSKLAHTEGRECWKRPSYRPSIADPTSTINQALPLPFWGNPDATGDESLKHHGVVRLRYQSGRIPSPTGEADEVRCDMTVRLRLRKYTLCGTRLFLQ